MTQAPVLLREELIERVREARRSDETIGLCCGIFDLLHAGHADYLSAAAECCDRLVVAVNGETSAARLKGIGLPLNSFEDRARLIAGLRGPAWVVELIEERPAALIEALRPDYYIKGGDYRPGQLRSAPLVEAYGGEIRIIPLRGELSSSELRRRAAAAYLEGASLTPRAHEGRAPGLIVDRDGTLIEDHPLLDHSDELRLLDGAKEALARLCQAGIRIAIVTNQQGLGLGLLDRRRYLDVSMELLRRLGIAGARVERIYTAPEPLGSAGSRAKPSPELYRQAIDDLRFDVSRTWVIGDRGRDLAAADELGLKALRFDPARGWKAYADEILDALS